MVTARGRGSSPHTRGAPRHLHLRRQASRIIPAYAGSTDAGVEVLGGTQDHPRIRGEHTRTGRGPSWRPGSSPHTRGALGLAARRVAAGGIIPAYAGSTRRRHRIQIGHWDHPRIRGEHGRCPSESGRSARIIPAYAGSTLRDRRGARNVGDHPRIRGEHDETYRKELNQTGSSPHTRGALACGQGISNRTGIIPAYAGSTVVLTLVVSRDHGSSPHTRGALCLSISSRSGPRIIPAYAGSTPSGTTRRAISRDHPRIRGEHAQRHDPKGVFTGSSPHTRGARGGVLVHLPDAGIIPAYAGSTFLVPFLSGLCQDHPRIRGEHYLS